MTRYYLSPIIGDGTRDNPYRAKIQEYGVSHVASIPTGKDGRPLKSWCLCQVNADNHAPLLADPDLQALPDTGKLADAPILVRQRLLLDLVSRGVSLRSDANTDARDIVRQIGQSLDGSFNQDRLFIR